VMPVISAVLAMAVDKSMVWSQIRLVWPLDRKLRFFGELNIM